MMKSLVSTLIVAMVIPLGVCFMAPEAHADNPITRGFAEGRWRVEIGAGTGVHSGRRDRTSDVLVTGNVEYEWPIYARGTLGLRAYPLFSYLQDDPSETIQGGGIGFVTRYYQNADVLNGYYAEGGAGIVFHTNHIEGNSATMDFLLEAGVGYQFPQSDWHVALQFQHVSNGGLSDNNAGANSLGVAVGYTF